MLIWAKEMERDKQKRMNGEMNGKKERIEEWKKKRKNCSKEKHVLFLS